MLPLHHAAGATSRTTELTDTPSLRTGAPSSGRVRPKQERPSRGSPQKACFSMNADPLGRHASVITHVDQRTAAIEPQIPCGHRHVHFRS